MKKKKSILHLCEATFLLLLLILISTLYLLKYLQTPESSYSPMLHLIQLTLLLVVLTLALTLIQRELLSRLLVNAFRDITGIHNKTSLENKITELGELPSTFGIGVMMFDLNNLKHVNDTYGHKKTGSYQAEFFHDPTDKCCYSNRLFRIRYRKDSSASTRCNRQPYHCRYFHRYRKFSLHQ